MNRVLLVFMGLVLLLGCVIPQQYPVKHVEDNVSNVSVNAPLTSFHVKVVSVNAEENNSESGVDEEEQNFSQVEQQLTNVEQVLSTLNISDEDIGG